MILRLFALLLCFQVASCDLIKGFVKGFYAGDNADVIYASAVYGNSIFLAVGSDVIERDVDTGRVVRTVKGHSSNVFALAISSNILVSGGAGSLLIATDLDTGNTIWVLRPQAADSVIYSLCAHQGVVYAGLADGSVRSYVATTGSPRRQFTGTHSNAVVTMVAANGNLYTGSLDSTIGKWDLGAGTIEQVLTDHDGPVYSLDFDAGGSLYSTSEDGMTLKWNTETGEIIMNYQKGNFIATILSVGDGVLYVGLENSEILVLNTTDGELITKLEGHTSEAYAMTLTQEYLFTSGTDMSTIKWDLNTNTMVSRLEGVNSALFTVAANTDFFFTGGNNGLKKWKRGMGNSLPTPVYSKSSHNDGVSAMELYQNTYFTGHFDGYVRRWNATSNDIIYEFKAHNDSINDICISGLYLFTASEDGFVRKWRISDAQVMASYTDEENPAPFVFVSKSGYNIMAGTSKNYILHYNGDTDVLIRTISTGLTGSQRMFTAYSYNTDLYVGFSRGVFIVDYDPDSSEPAPLATSGSPVTAFYIDAENVVFGLQNGFVQLLKRTPGSQPVGFPAHGSSVSAFATVRDQLYSVGTDGAIYLWSLSTLRPSFYYYDRTTSSIALAVNQNYVVSAQQGGKLEIFDSKTAKLSKTDEFSNSFISDAIFLNDTLITGTSDGSIVAYDNSLARKITKKFGSTAVSSLFYFENSIFIGFLDGRILRSDNSWNATISEYSYPAALSAIYAHDGFLFAGGADSTIVQYALDSGLLVRTLNEHRGGVNTLTVISGDLFSGSNDLTIIRWRISSGTVVQTYQRSPGSLGHTGAVTTIVNCKGSLFSGGEDRVVYRWALVEGQPINALTGHTGKINKLACFDGLIYSASDDGTILQWNPNLGDYEEYYPETNTGITETATSSARDAPSSSISTSRTGDLGQSQNGSQIGIEVIAAIAAVAGIIVLAVIAILVKYYLNTRKAAATLDTTVGNTTTKFMSLED